MSRNAIIFIHRGNSWYLPIALQQVVKTNPKARIVLLGDESNARYGDIVEHKMISSYFESARKFESIYQHKSFSNKEYELFNFQRWFVWRDFMRAEGIAEAMLPDTDVLFLGCIDGYLSGLPHHVSYTYGKSNHMGFMFIRLYALELFCEYLEKCYSSPNVLQRFDEDLKDWYMQHPSVGGISDITLFQMFYDEYGTQRENPIVRWCDETNSIDGDIFVHSLQSEEFVLNNRGGWKCLVINILNGCARAETKSGEVVRIIGVHCFGAQKEYMMKLYNAEGWYYWRLRYYWKTSFLHQLIRKIRNNL